MYNRAERVSRVSYFALGRVETIAKRFAGLSAIALVCAGIPATAQDSLLQFKDGQIIGPACASKTSWPSLTPVTPCEPSELQSWFDDAVHWRLERRTRVGLDARSTVRPELAWTQSSFIQTQMMVHDRFFYDPDQKVYTVNRYLDDLKARYGGIDSVLVWPVYPNIGIDDRNQFDFFSDLPGGTTALRAVVNDFHAHGVKVLFPILPWDQGTRDSGQSDADVLVKNLKTIGADGINGDTMDGVPSTFRKVSDGLSHPLALEPELSVASDEMLNWNHMGWAYWTYGIAPVVSRAKWMKPSYMLHISNRFAHNHTDDLQNAFFNGAGFESWENVWGIWNGLTLRDAEALRRLAAIERFAAPFLISEGWRPFAPMLQYGAFSSRWPYQSETLWTVINRNKYSIVGEQLKVPHQDGMRYFDLWHGEEIHASVDDRQDTISFAMEDDGFGAILATASPSADLQRYLTTVKREKRRVLSDLSTVRVTLSQELVPIARTAPVRATPKGMSFIPTADYSFRVQGVEIEGENDKGVDIQYPGESSPRRYHQIKMHIPAFWMDTTPVTNAAFKNFLDRARYRPSDPHNFLRDWKNGSYPPGWGNKPVTWVSIEDARAYARWAGKRLPHEWEWQYAAQGLDERAYPWGDAFEAAKMPVADHGRVMAPASDVDAHPNGASPFGVIDLVGNVWQWTDEWRDSHTRAAIVRGGSHYRPSGSRWYFPSATPLSVHGKYLLMAPSLDRSGAVGFRCVADLAE